LKLLKLILKLLRGASTKHRLTMMKTAPNARAIIIYLWRRINRPHKDLRLNTVLKGIQDFAEAFKGTFVSETMLIDGIRYYIRKLLSRGRQ
jgi:hypothetical protein